jgi:hypothetical protein
VSRNGAFQEEDRFGSNWDSGRCEPSLGYAWHKGCFQDKRGDDAARTKERQKQMSLKEMVHAIGNYFITTEHGDRPVVIIAGEESGWLKTVNIRCDDPDNPAAPIFIELGIKG